MTEHQIQNQILRTFGTRPSIRLWRSNTGEAYGASVVGRVFGLIRRGAFSDAVAVIACSRPVRFGVPGQADLHGIIAGGRFLAIEVKSATGRQSPEQRAYQEMVTRFGGLYVLARSVEDVAAALEGHA